MKQHKFLTPFPTVGYYGPQYFCDRELETERLITNLKGGQSTTLTAIRRIGKTALIKHLNYLLKDDVICVYTDILPAENSLDFLNSLATAILNAVPQKTKFGQKIWSFIKSLRPVISFDTLSGDPNVSFNIHPKESENQIELLFDFLESQDKQVLISIDEFQQILNFPESNIEAWLRSIIQKLKNIVFIFSGSEQHLLNEMFADPSKPFFRSSLFMHLGRISHESYSRFITQKFSEHSKVINEKVVSEILDWTYRHTYYVQLLCNRIFLSSGKTICSGDWQLEASKLIKEQEYVFLGYRDILTKQQWNLLKSIAFEGQAYSLTSKDFVQRYKLGSSATVLRSLKSLQSKGLIYREFNEGKKFFSVYDVLFQRWIQNH
jgi:hypothetical protein